MGHLPSGVLLCSLSPDGIPHPSDTITCPKSSCLPLPPAAKTCFSKVTSLQLKKVLPRGTRPHWWPSLSVGPMHNLVSDSQPSTQRISGCPSPLTESRGLGHKKEKSSEWLLAGLLTATLPWGHPSLQPQPHRRPLLTGPGSRPEDSYFSMILGAFPPQ